MWYYLRTLGIHHRNAYLNLILATFWVLHNAFRLFSIILLTPLPQKSVVSGFCIKTCMHQSIISFGASFGCYTHHSSWASIHEHLRSHKMDHLASLRRRVCWTVKRAVCQQEVWAKLWLAKDLPCTSWHHALFHWFWWLHMAAVCLFTQFPDYSFRTGHTSSWVLLCLDWCLSAQLLVSMIAETMVWMPSPHVTFSILSKSYKEVSKHRLSRCLR